jgi:hypothetical protein
VRKWSWQGVDNKQNSSGETSLWIWRIGVLSEEGNLYWALRCCHVFQLKVTASHKSLKVWMPLLKRCLPLRSLFKARGALPMCVIMKRHIRICHYEHRCNRDNDNKMCTLPINLHHFSAHIFIIDNLRWYLRPP